jgi:hypothetical protein
MGTSRTRTSVGAGASRTLADDLRARDDASVAALLRARPDLARPTPTDSSQVASRATARHSVSAALDDLDTRSLTALAALVVLGEPARLSDVAVLLGGDDAVAAGALSRLRALALVWGPDDDLRTVRAATEVLGPHPAGLGPPAASLGLPLLDDDTLAARVAELDAPGRELLGRLSWGPPTGSFTPGSPVLPLVERLVASGLVATTVGGTSVVMPREVALHLRGGLLSREVVDGPPALTPLPTSAADRLATGAALEVVRQVESLLERWSHDGPAVLRGGGVGVRELRTTAAALGIDEQRAGFLVEVAAATGLLGALDDPRTGERWAPTDAFDLWLGDSPAQRWAVLAAGWLGTERVLALVGRRDDKDRPINPLVPGLERRRTVQARRLALTVLDGLRPSAVAPDEVVARLAWDRPRLGAHRDTVVRATLTEAGWLGVTGRGALSPAGAALLDAGPGAAAAALAPGVPEPLREVLLQADLTAVAPGPLEREVATTMALLADVESQGGATVYRFSGSSLRRALDAGWPVEQVHAFLRTHSRTPVPQPLTFLVDDTSRRHGRVRLGLASLYLRSDDPTELDAVLGDPQLGGLGLRRIAPTVVLTDSDETLVLESLRAAGHAPLAESLDGSVHRPSRRPLRAPSAGRRRDKGGAGMSEGEARALVDAIRAGDVVTARRPDGSATTPRAGSLDALAALREAAQSAGSVWMSYMDQAGTLSERIVDPVRVDAGWLTAYDHRTQVMREFAVHRIRKVAPA